MSIPCTRLPSYLQPRRICGWCTIASHLKASDERHTIMVRVLSTAEWNGSGYILQMHTTWRNGRKHAADNQLCSTIAGIVCELLQTDVLRCRRTSIPNAKGTEQNVVLGDARSSPKVLTSVPAGTNSTPASDRPPHPRAVRPPARPTPTAQLTITQHNILFSALGVGYVRAAATLHVRAAIAHTLFQL